MYQIKPLPYKNECHKFQLLLIIHPFLLLIKLLALSSEGFNIDFVSQPNQSIGLCVLTMDIMLIFHEFSEQNEHYQV